MKIGIVGSGMVGATAAYAMVMRGVGREIVMVDVRPERAQAEADDLLHAVPFAHPIAVRAGGYADLAGCAVVVITAGVSQKPGETRLDLQSRNAGIMTQVVEQTAAVAPGAVLVIASNPLDVMTYLATQTAAKAGIPSSRVIGTGTMLDTARFRALLARAVGVDARHVHAWVLGEHGDSEVLTWSLATIGGIPLEEYCRLRSLEVCDSDRAEIEEQVRHAAYHIIEGKGATYYGVGSAIAQLVEVILRDQRSILTVSALHDEIAGVRDVCLSLPHLVGGEGIIATLPPTLSADESRGLQRSAQILRAAIEALKET